MLDLDRVDPCRIVAAVLVSIALFASACSGGARPTITGDRLEEAATAVASDAGQGAPPQPAEAAASAPTAEATSAVEDPSPAAEATSTPPPGVIEMFTVEVIETFPHDELAHTQGLELDNGVFVESTGLRGLSDLRRVDPTTGDVLQLVATPDDFFAEGLTKVGDEFVQLTYTSQTAFYWDATDFSLNRQVSYEGEGWGLCYDGDQILMSNGSADLVSRDPVTFEETSRVTVTYDGGPIAKLNELECVDGAVWANIYQSTFIVRIDPSTGFVTGLVDASSLYQTPDPVLQVLNGIAWDDTTGTFFVTGKNWPEMFRVNFVRQPG